MKIVKKAVNLFLVITILFCFFAPVFPVKADTAESNLFEVYLENGKDSSLLSRFATYQEAYSFTINKEKENKNDNLVIYKDGQIRYVTYGIVNFKIASKNKDSTTSYTIEHNGYNIGYTHPFSGADAAFLGTNEEGTKVRFKLSGVIGWVDYNQVEIINLYSNYDKTITSAYIMKKNDVWELKHNISLDIVSGKSVAITLGQERPNGMLDNKYYLSYDGHYFYEENLEGFKTMIQDYKAGNNGQAINASDPYYNYYQFLSHRSISNYVADNLKQDFSAYTEKPVYGTTLQDYQSQLYGEEISFIAYQNEFGANAILMLGTAKNESATGRSPLSIRTNNLFGHNAFDSSPGASASGYVSVAQGIYAHAKVFISEGYADPCDRGTVNADGSISNTCYSSSSRYFGAYVGNKSSGMNVRYASDPYWGEKAAQNYYYFDKKYGLQDYRKYGIGIKKNTNEKYPIKASADSKSATLYMTASSPDYAVTILSSVKGESINGSNIWYKIQTDPTLNSTRTGLIQDSGTYNYEHNIGYIHSSYLSYVKLGGKEKKRYTINFNPNGGVFNDNITATKSLSVEQYVIPVINTPQKEGYTFVGWDKEVVAATENVTYTAVYKAVEENYKIIFDAGLGTFTDGSRSKTLAVKAGTIPNIEAPARKGYLFIGWSPSLKVASKNTTYTAQYKKEEEVNLKETTGEFYFHELTSDKNGLFITGYSTLTGVQNNSKVSVSYSIEFENTDTKEIISIPLNRITDTNKMPYQIGTINGYDATYSWFNGTISLEQLKAGNYHAYIVAKSGELYTRKLVRNLFGKKMVGNYEQDGKQLWIRNNYYLKTVPMEFFVRDQKIGNKDNDPIDNMITGYSKISFEGNNLKIRGFAHNVSGDYAPKASVSRTIILENNKTYQTKKNAISTITSGDYAISLRVSDGFDKTKAWFEGSIDISTLEKGSYTIYISNSANINDFAELNDIFNKPISEKTEINGKKYSLKINENERYRVELIVQ